MSYTIDDQYSCFFCKKLLLYYGYQKIVVETETYKEHICDPPTSIRPKEEVGLESMQAERKAQEEYYHGFFSSAQFKTYAKPGQKQRGNK
jgi:hypothetical protein